MAFPVNDSYSCASGGEIVAGRHRISAFTGLMGDSLTDEGFGLSPFYMANASLGGKLDLLSNSGWSGTTVSGMLARIALPYTNVPPGFGGLPHMGRIFVRAGTNDARGDLAIGSLAATYTILLNACATYADKVIVLAVPPLGNETHNARCIEYNAWLTTFCAANPSVFRFVDDCVNVRNVDNSIKLEYFDPDEIHFNELGTAQLAIDLAAAIGTEYSSYASPVSLDANDKYPARPQWFANPTMLGTSGSASGGFTGQVVNNLSISGYGAGMAGTCSVVAADGGDSNQTPWQRISLSTVQTDSSIWINSAMVGRAMSSVDPVGLESIIEVRFNAVPRAAINYILTYAQADTGEKLCTDQKFQLIDTGVESGTFVLRVKRRRSGSSSPSSLLWHLFIKARSTLSGGLGSIDLRSLTVRG